MYPGQRGGHGGGYGTIYLPHPNLTRTGFGGHHNPGTKQRPWMRIYMTGYLPHPNLKRIIGDNTIQVQRGCHGKGYGSGYLPHPNPRRTIEEQREDS